VQGRAGWGWGTRRRRGGGMALPGPWRSNLGVFVRMKSLQWHFAGEYNTGMSRRPAEREQLKVWALTWEPQPTHDRLNRYARLKGRWSEYHKGRVVLQLTPAEYEKARSIYHHLCIKHAGKVRANPRYCRILWACAISRCRKNSAHRYERLAVVNKLTYWHDAAHREGVRALGIPSLEERRAEVAPSAEPLPGKRPEAVKSLAHFDKRMPPRL
jgi:hypothetical protein